MSSAPPSPRRPRPVSAALIGLLAMYVGVYGWARVTHHLVFNGHGVTGPHASSGPAGFTTWELVFLPLGLTESVVRSALR